MRVLVVYFLVFLSLGTTQIQGSNDNERKPYIVYMGEKSPQIQQLARVQHHHLLLVDAIGDLSIAKEARIHSYGRSFNGFAANLLPSEAVRLSEKSGVVSVFPSTIRQVVTTRSWDFMGMPENLVKRNHKIESDTIIGVLDTGIYIEAPSFDDKECGPVPRKWKGKCDKGLNFTGCNRKVIGARFYNLGESTGMDPTPADTDGHGTHTSSTAAGNSVKGASLYNVAKGTARGAVPSARVAMYKICGTFGCSDVNILAAFDDAISDGVDIISVSIGGPTKIFLDDVIAIGSFHAIRKGILTVCAGGNLGPDEGTVGNVAPWIFTVGATNMDREFRTVVKLGNGKTINGISINTFAPKKSMFPLISSALAFNATTYPYTNASACTIDTLQVKKVKDKIVFCKGYSGADYSVRMSHGAGTIISLDDLTTDMASTTLIPTTLVSVRHGAIIDHYINTTKSPQAYIYKSITVHTTKAPVVAAFSSRGPQKVAGNILKPDIVAPGVDILAGYSKLVSITGEPLDTRMNVFNIISGTSMSTPHVSGAAAYVRTFHPNWSPAAIKSALMTTARPVNGEGNEKPLDSGSGLLNPVDAAHPGLVYDLSNNDYARYLCKEGINSSTIAKLSSDKIPHFDCSKFKKGRGSDGINYPSFHYQLGFGESKMSVRFHRTVTYVGNGPSVFKARILTGQKGASVRVVPDALVFTRQQEKRSFRVEVQGQIPEGAINTFTAWVEWTDAKHRVRSPILIYRQGLD
ncbi:subtilisin-like protease SBT4.15 [Silene latifolia]|uniref:subtilisin-like protease SBT4.15 n=1 Tax=Silene latifolia TaxID=37657 RepID=UPI003D76B9EC